MLSQAELGCVSRTKIKEVLDTLAKHVVTLLSLKTVTIAVIALSPLDFRWAVVGV